MTRLALGTAQFGERYGVANVCGQVDASAVAAILARAGEAGLDTLDTAVSYGNSESCLGQVGVSSWRVITKLPALPASLENVSEWVVAHVRGSRERLRIERLEALLLHKPSDVLGPHGRALLEALEALKARGSIGAAGVSIYDPSELNAIVRVWQPDLVQAPFNVLDRRLMRSGWLTRLRSAGVRVHVRSLFLQGLLLLPESRRPTWFGCWRALLDRWSDWCQRNETTALHAALAFVQGTPGIERLVVGVDSVEQLEGILAASSSSGTRLPPEDLFSDDPDLIDPSRWKLT